MEDAAEERDTNRQRSQNTVEREKERVEEGAADKTDKLCADMDTLKFIWLPSTFYLAGEFRISFC